MSAPVRPSAARADAPGALGAVGAVAVGAAFGADGDLPAEELTAQTPRPLRATLLTQTWLDVAFLHWSVAPERVAPLLPAGTRPDVHDGSTWVGLVGFRMLGLGFGSLPGVPYLGTFAETNVRLYSVDGAGRRGVVFRSLDVPRLLPALVSRVWPRVPYTWSAMSAPVGPDFTYRTRRRWPRPARTVPPRADGIVSRFVVRPGAAIDAPSDLERFLTARWGLHTTSLTGRPRYLPNDHPTWPLRRAEVLALDDGPAGLVAAAGLPGVTAEPPASVLFSDGVRVRFGPPEPRVDR